MTKQASEEFWNQSEIGFDVYLLQTKAINHGNCPISSSLKSILWILADFRHNRIVQSPHENYLNVCRAAHRKVRSSEDDNLCFLEEKPLCVSGLY